MSEDRTNKTPASAATAILQDATQSAQWEFGLSTGWKLENEIRGKLAYHEGQGEEFVRDMVVAYTGQDRPEEFAAELFPEADLDKDGQVQYEVEAKELYDLLVDQAVKTVKETDRAFWDTRREYALEGGSWDRVCGDGEVSAKDTSREDFEQRVQAAVPLRSLIDEALDKNTWLDNTLQSRNHCAGERQAFASMQSELETLRDATIDALTEAQCTPPQVPKNLPSTEKKR